MAIAEIPPPQLRPEPAYTATEVPVLLVQLQDDLTRSRLREAFWISVVVHLLVVLAIALSPKWYPVGTMRVITAADLLKDQNLTYLEAPPDTQKVTKRPDTNIISDKDRIATRKAPTIDRETLERLRDNRRPGIPGSSSVPSPPSPPAVAQAQGSQQQALQPQAQPPAQQDQTAELRSPPVATAPKPSGAFGGGMSPGSIVQQAIRGSVATRGGGIGTAGEYGLGTGPSQGKVASDIEILNDTMGVDFAPYLERLRRAIYINWYALMPESVRPPLMKRGKVFIQFAILKDGTVAGMQLVTPSGDVSLDRAAWGAITASNPFSPLPREFGGQYLALRCHFYYNPEKADLE